MVGSSLEPQTHRNLSLEPSEVIWQLWWEGRALDSLTIAIIERCIPFVYSACF